MRARKITDKSIQQDTTIRLNFEGGAWACMTFTKMKNNWTNVVITSDWGKWEYGWGEQTNYPSLFHWIRKEDIGYFRGKFFGGEPDIFNCKRTLTEFRKIVKKEVPWIEDREKNEHLMFLIRELEGCENEDELYHRMDKELTDVLGDEIWHLFKYEPHPRASYFSKYIFPKFFPEIKKISKEMGAN
jgi:hypothetical protein